MSVSSEFSPTTKRPRSQADKRFTYHLKRLATKKVCVIREAYEACKPTKRDIARGCVGSTLVYNQYLAAKFLLEMADAESIETAKLGLYLDRTEGKVAQELITLDGNKLIEQLEAARQRVLNPAYNPPTQSLQAIDGEVVSEHALDQQSSEAEAARTTPPPGGQALGPIRPQGPMSIPATESET